MKCLLLFALLGASGVACGQAAAGGIAAAEPLATQSATPAAQSTAPAATTPDTAAAQAAAALRSGDPWGHLQALPLHVRIHVAADSRGKACNFLSADETTLTCSKVSSGQGKAIVFQRADVRSVKLTRRTISTVGGLGIGFVAGFGIGSAVGHAVDPANGGGWFAGLGGAIITGFSAVVGGVGGAVVGGSTDFLRGPTVYQRPTPTTAGAGSGGV